MPICYSTFTSADALSRGCAFCRSFNSCVKKTLEEKVAEEREKRSEKAIEK